MIAVRDFVPDGPPVPTMPPSAPQSRGAEALRWAVLPLVAIFACRGIFLTAWRFSRTWGWRHFPGMALSVLYGGAGRVAVTIVSQRGG